MDFNKLKNNKALQIAAIIALPTVLVAGYFGYKYIKRKRDERKESQYILDMREKYKDINSVDDFVQGVKYVSQPIQFGYDFELIEKNKDKLSSINFDELKDYYELMKENINDKSEDENIKLINFLENIFNKQ
jgi:hypothetical protein